MPRRAKPPTGMIIQGLSEGKQPEPEMVLEPDDFGDGMVLVPKPIEPERMLSAFYTDHRVREAVRQRAIERKAKQARLERTAKTVNKIVHDMIDPPKAKPKHNQVHTASGLVITVPPNPNKLKRRL